MTLDGLVTFLALLIAVFAVMPQVARMRLQLHGTWHLTISLLCFPLVLYLQFFDLVGQSCWPILGGYCEIIDLSRDGRIEPGRLSFVVILFWLFLAWAISIRSRLSLRALPRLSALTSELSFERRYADLIRLLLPQLPLLEKAYNRDTKLAQLHDWLRDLGPNRRSWNRILSLNRDEEYEDRWYEKGIFLAFSTGMSKAVNIVPSGRKSENAAKEIFRLVLLSPEFTKYLATFRPEFGVRLLSCAVHPTHEFCQVFMTHLISNTQSSLYNEIKQNQNISAEVGYWFPEHNQLLYCLFSNPEIAREFEVYRPIGENILSNLRASENADYLKFLNGRADQFDQEERWRDKSFIAIRFFDLMVTAAAYKGVQWHMWLYYFPIILKRIDAFYDASGPEIDAQDEWPTRASYLIYRIFDALTDWIRLVEHLPEDSPHLVIDSDRPVSENGNIPKSAALALGQCLGTLLRSHKIDPRFQQYIHDIVMREMRELRGGMVPDRFRNVMIKSIINVGYMGTDPVYGAKLKAMFSKTDHVIRSDLDDYVTALHEAYP